MSEKLTKKQKAVLECIEDCIAKKGYGPTDRPVFSFDRSRSSEGSRGKGLYRTRSFEVSLHHA